MEIDSRPDPFSPALYRLASWCHIAWAICPISLVLLLHRDKLADWTHGHFGGRVCEQQGSLIPSGMFGMLVPVLSTVASIPAICDLKRLRS